MLQPAAVQEAHTRLAGVVNQTPVMGSRSLSRRYDCEFFFKCEHFQRTGSFKFRGAYNTLSQLSEAEKANGVVTHSSGNHAQGVALAARLLGVGATIVMPDDASPAKRAATLDYGARIVTASARQREELSAALVAEHAFTLVHPYDDDRIIAGQGTAALELFDAADSLDVLFVPVGGGGLISGCALAAQAIASDCRVVGVEPATAADAGQSWRQNRVIELEETPGTIADGLRTRFVGQRNLEIMRRYVADMITVSEEDIVAALQFLWTRLKLLVEPSAAVALAPILNGSFPVQGKRVGILLSGGNFDLEATEIVGAASPKAVWINGEMSRRQPGAAGQTAAEPAPVRPRLLLCDRVGDDALAILASEAEVVDGGALSEEELLKTIGEYQAIVVSKDTLLDGQLLEYGYQLRTIGCMSTRLDNIDVSAARALGIEVFNAPASTAVAIAEHTMALLLNLAVQFSDGRLAGKTLGIVGYGPVGEQVSRRAQAFDMHVLVNQPRLTPELALSPDAEAVDLEALLRQADFVSLHLPPERATEAIIDSSQLALMKPTACLINVGHTDLVDDASLQQALDQGRLAAAALTDLPRPVAAGGAPQASMAVRRHEKVLVSPHVSQIIDDRTREMELHVARRVVQHLAPTAYEALSLELVPVSQVAPHEEVDDKRVDRLQRRLREDGVLVNPPVTTLWKGTYVILDGATRFTSFKRLGFQHIIVQVVKPDTQGFALHTWYHAISSPESADHLLDHLAKIEGLELAVVSPAETRTALLETQTLGYLLTRDGRSVLVRARDGQERLAAMNALVASYTAWGRVERTLLTDLDRLKAQFPELAAVVVFPQIEPETVFEVASQGRFLPAGLTRFVIPGRILRLNASLDRLRHDEPLATKRAWFNRFLHEKLARSRLRYYQEPVILLDE